MCAWNIDLIYTNSSVLGVGILAAKLLRLPHVWHLREAGDLHYAFRHHWGAAIFRLVIQSSDAVVTVSNSLCLHLFGPNTTAKVHIVYNGILSTQQFDQLYHIASTRSTESSRYTFAIVGLIHPSKGQAVAIKALRLVLNQHGNTRLLIVGDGDVEPIKQLVKALAVQANVEFWGYLDDPYKAYLEADAVLMCSQHEAMGRVTAEAMAACRPVIGYKSGGTPEILEDGYTGLLYSEGAEALAQCMVRFIENRVWARQLGENGWQVARKKYNTETYANHIYEVLCALHPSI